MITAPPNSTGNDSPITVTTGISALRRMCRVVIKVSRRPLARIEAELPAARLDQVLGLRAVGRDHRQHRVAGHLRRDEEDDDRDAEQDRHADHQPAQQVGDRQALLHFPLLDLVVDRQIEDRVRRLRVMLGRADDALANPAAAYFALIGSAPGRPDLPRSRPIRRPAFSRQISIES
jgi:hypothetical protein